MSDQTPPKDQKVEKNGEKEEKIEICFKLLESRVTHEKVAYKSTHRFNKDATLNSIINHLREKAQAILGSIRIQIGEEVSDENDKNFTDRPLSTLNTSPIFFVNREFRYKEDEIGPTIRVGRISRTNEINKRRNEALRREKEQIDKLHKEFMKSQTKLMSDEMTKQRKIFCRQIQVLETNEIEMNRKLKNAKDVIKIYEKQETDWNRRSKIQKATIKNERKKTQRKSEEMEGKLRAQKQQITKLFQKQTKELKDNMAVTKSTLKKERKSSEQTIRRQKKDYETRTSRTKEEYEKQLKELKDDFLRHESQLELKDSQLKERKLNVERFDRELKQMRIDYDYLAESEKKKNESLKSAVIDNTKLQIQISSLIGDLEKKRKEIFGLKSYLTSLSPAPPPPPPPNIQQSQQQQQQQQHRNITNPNIHQQFHLHHRHHLNRPYSTTNTNINTNTTSNTNTPNVNITTTNTTGGIQPPDPPPLPNFNIFNNFPPPPHPHHPHHHTNDLGRRPQRSRFNWDDEKYKKRR